MYPGAASRIHDRSRRWTVREESGGPRAKKNMEKSSIAREGTRRVAKNSRRAKTQCVLLAHGDGSFLAILFRRFASRGRRFIGSRLNVKHCTRSSLPDKFCIRLHIKVDANVTLLQVC